MWSWRFWLIVALSVLWVVAIVQASIWLHDDDVAMRDYEAERDAFEQYFE